MNIKKVLIINKNELYEKIKVRLIKENILANISFITNKENLSIQLLGKDMGIKKELLVSYFSIIDEGNYLLELDGFKTILKLFNIQNITSFDKYFKKGDNYYFELSE